MGPIDLVVLGFPGNQFKGEILPELQRVVDAGIIRVIDVLMAVRIGDQPVRVLELQEIEDEILQRFQPVAADVTQMLSEADAYALSADLPPDSSVVLLLFENTWASRIADAVANADGRLIMNERIPRAVVERLVADAAAAAA